MHNRTRRNVSTGTSNRSVSRRCDRDGLERSRSSSATKVSNGDARIILDFSREVIEVNLSAVASVEVPIEIDELSCAAVTVSVCASSALTPSRQVRPASAAVTVTVSVSVASNVIAPKV